MRSVRSPLGFGVFHPFASFGLVGKRLPRRLGATATLTHMF